MTDTIVHVALGDARVQPLLQDLAAEYERRYGDLLKKDDGIPEMERYPASAFAPPDGNFLLLLRDEVVVGGGAFMRYDEHTAEFKRIWTHRDQRRQGIARRVVAELEAQAARQGYARVYLTTGFRQPEAVGLYLGYGYTPMFEQPVDPAVPRVLPFTKVLRPDAPVQAYRTRPSPWRVPTDSTAAATDVRG